MNNIQNEIKRQGKLTRSHLQTYEQFIEGYKQYKALKDNTEYLHLQELYNNSSSQTERKALNRALYEMEVL